MAPRQAPWSRLVAWLRDLLRALAPRPVRPLPALLPAPVRVRADPSDPPRRRAPH